MLIACTLDCRFAREAPASQTMSCTSAEVSCHGQRSRSSRSGFMRTKTEDVFRDRSIVFAVSTQLIRRFAMSSAGVAMTRLMNDTYRIFQTSILFKRDEVDNIV